MTLLLLRTLLIVTVLVVSATSTPPPGYVKKPDNDEHPPSYQYKYEIEDNGGERYGKSEAREGEHATGRYYVNSKRSSTDVKYFADEWGYHPVVKYDSSDDHSRASASFAIGEKAVQNLQDENIGQASSSFLVTGDKGKIVQIIQPYLKVQQVAEENVVSSSSNVDSSTVLSLPAETPGITYVTSSPQKENIKLGSSTPDNDIFQSTIIREQSSDLASNNDLTSTVLEENRLSVENAGSFGQRLQAQGEDASVYSVSASTVNSISAQQNEVNSGTRDTRYFRGRLRSKGGKAYLPETGFTLYSSTASPLYDISVTANSIETVNAQGQDTGNVVVKSNSGLEFYSTSGQLGGVSVTTANPLLINYGSQNLLLSGASAAGVKSQDVAGVSEIKDYVFSKPIVVPEVAKEIPFQYSTTFKCDDDEEAISSTPNPLAAIQESLRDITASTHVLNPIQAGVALVNAGEAHLISNGDSVNDRPPAPVNEKVEDIPQSDQAPIQTSNIVGAQESNYVGINPAFGGQQETTKQQQQNEQIVEAQKSVEIYQNLVRQRAQVVKQQAASQNSNSNEQSNVQNYENQQQQFSSNNELNSTDLTARIGNSISRSETLSKVYEVGDNYPKDQNGNQQIYVVPPATYIVDDSSILKNSLLQEKLQYVTEGSQSRIYTEDQQIKDTQNGIVYERETVNEHPQNNNNILKVNLGIPQTYAVEKVIEKKVPYTIEKIVEKKIPVPKPYPVPIEVPVPQPLPIPVEKVVEKKIPVPVHIPIPHPYPVEKPIHIPIPIEKIIEKPVHIPIPIEKIIEKKIPVPQPFPIKIEKIIERKIPYPVEVTKYIEKPINIQAPYGVQYGVSYQQIMKPQHHGLYSSQSNYLSPLYALSLSANNLYNNNNNLNKNLNEGTVNNSNHSQIFQGYIYDKPVIPFNEGKENLDTNQLLNTKTSGKKLAYHSYAPSSYSLSNTLLHRRHTSNVHRPNKFDRDDYFGPVPPVLHLQRQYGFQTKSFSPYMSIDRTQNPRQARAHEHPRHQKGNFRQSKIEYGFKPPMVPSVQYDEETASKVES